MSLTPFLMIPFLMLLFRIFVTNTFLNFRYFFLLTTGHLILPIFQPVFFEEHQNMIHCSTQPMKQNSNKINKPISTIVVFCFPQLFIFNTVLEISFLPNTVLPFSWHPKFSSQHNMFRSSPPSVNIHLESLNSSTLTFFANCFVSSSKLIPRKILFKRFKRFLNSIQTSSNQPLLKHLLSKLALKSILILLYLPLEQLFSKIIYNTFLLSSKLLPFEQFYRLHLTGSKITICEPSSSDIFILDNTSFEQGIVCFPHDHHDAFRAFNNF